MSELTKREQERLERKAQRLDQGIRKCVRVGRELWPTLAALCYELKEERAWEIIGHSTLEAYLADPEIELERRTFFRLAQLHSELVLKHEIDPARLGTMPVSRVQEVLPAITSGLKDVDEALSYAEVTPVRDLREWARDPDAPIDPSKEKMNCPTCGSRISPERLEAV